MIGWQLRATNANNPLISIRGNVIYMDKAPAQRMLADLRRTEQHDMVWDLAAVDVQLERV